jgi:hypothetical protein
MRNFRKDLEIPDSVFSVLSSLIPLFAPHHSGPNLPTSVLTIFSTPVREEVYPPHIL